MHSTRLINLLTLALSVSSVTGVAWLDDKAGKGQVAVRQDNILTIGPDVSSADSAASSTDEPASSSTDAPDSSSTSDSSSESSPTPTSSSDSSTPTPTDSPTTSNGPTTSNPTSSPKPTSSITSSTSAGGDGGNNDQTSTTAPPVTSTFMTVITTTDSAGQTFVSSSSSVIVSTPTPVSDSQDDNKSAGMTPQVRSTIIGVCVGVGGAIVLAAAGVLFWRLRSKKRSQEENEELVSYGDGFGGPGTAEKTEPSGAAANRSPFQSTLESYHAPSSTNAASNF
ncbi:uncharacterized protein F4822DRAFT_425182 [Hypoxylon trugodes]|uniref:uncharacterized protein n=1 Tax=Hypoxylon trugodes TaxID=326681 RepID=UPI002193398F|nr:uncharacterized protein F4822DRAFT_425182 [Hypoxylon trugodes]KAI1391965.1 hypothetical protein F4822DRAFT_425182 [Hypoxylon trugodes]